MLVVEFELSMKDSLYVWRGMKLEFLILMGRFICEFIVIYYADCSGFGIH